MSDSIFSPDVTAVPIPVREILPWVIFVGLSCYSQFTSSGQRREPLRSSPECMCTNSCMMGAICLASLVIDQTPIPWSDPCLFVGCW